MLHNIDYIDPHIIPKAAMSAVKDACETKIASSSATDNASEKINSTPFHHARY
jgi:hypothetical protein